MATAWTDPTIITGQTLVKCVHFTEMGTAINNETRRRGLGTSTPPSISVGSYITKDYITWLRNRITGYFSSIGTDMLTPGSVIKAVHVTELRTKINALESNPHTRGAVDCYGTCTGLCNNACTSCTGCTGCTGCTSCTSCSGGCTSCTSCSGSCKGRCSGHCSGCSWLW
jgi:hypothetical protein